MLLHWRQTVIIPQEKYMPRAVLALPLAYPSARPDCNEACAHRLGDKPNDDATAAINQHSLSWPSHIQVQQQHDLSIHLPAMVISQLRPPSLATNSIEGSMRCCCINSVCVSQQHVVHMRTSSR